VPRLRVRITVVFYYGSMGTGATGEDLSSPLISVIVPITRMFGRLDELKSWLKEIDWEKIEVILVHDLQDEMTSDSLRLISSEYPMLQLIEKTYQSAGLARNAGIEASRGNWIVFWDSDDKPSVSVLKEFFSDQNRDSFDVYVFGFAIESNKKTIFHETHNWREIAFHPGIWRIIFSKSAIFNSRFPSFPLGEDQYFLGLINLPKRRLRYLDQSIYSYQSGVEGQATSRKSNLFRIIESLHALDYLRKNQTGSDHEFTSIMYWRQIFTLAKRGNVRLKLKAILIGLKSLMKINRNYFRTMRALMYVLVRVLVRNA
jgi:hypothetical protein